MNDEQQSLLMESKCLLTMQIIIHVAFDNCKRFLEKNVQKKGITNNIFCVGETMYFVLEYLKIILLIKN